MDIPRHGKQIVVGIYKECLISPLVEIPRTMVPMIIHRRVGDIKMAHELRQVAPGRLDDKVKMIRHAHIREEVYIVYLKRKGESFEEYCQVFIVGKDAAPLIPPAGNVIVCIGILDSQRPRHSLIVPPEGEMSRTKI